MIMVIANLLEFLRSGEIDRIHLGMSRQQLVEITDDRRQWR